MAMAYILTTRCLMCGNKWKVRRIAEDIGSIKDPDCPVCKKAAKRSKFNPAGGKAPSVGGSHRVKAADKAAEMIMKDHGLTDMRGVTDARYGENTAPKLPAHIQNMADNMFSPKKQMEGVIGERAGGTVANIMSRQALAGGYAHTNGQDPVTAVNSQRRSVHDTAIIINRPGT